MRTLTLLVLSVFIATTNQARAARDPAYHGVIERVVNMTADGDLQRRASVYGLNVLNVLWEDTGRAGGSALGPNISDVTLQVREPLDGDRVQTHLLPVIRFPNFTDKTGDVAAEKLWVRVGNQKNDGKLDNVPLTEVLKHLRKYLSDPKSMRGDVDFSAPRDTHFLVSAQHVFVPIGKRGKAEFTPVIFNYQSAPGSPAVLTLLVTRQGLSASVIENKPGDQSLQGWGQQLFFNNAGQRTTFTAERKSDVAHRVEGGQATAQDAGALDQGADMLMVIQVPLKHANRGYLSGLAFDDVVMPAPPAAAMPVAPREAAKDDVEVAVLGHGADQGPFHELENLELERDPAFPVRVTVQFYRATSNGVVSDQSLADVAKMIDRVYADADYVGSLVVPEGPRYRPTDWINDHPNAYWNPWRTNVVTIAK